MFMVVRNGFEKIVVGFSLLHRTSFLDDNFRHAVCDPVKRVKAIQFLQGTSQLPVTTTHQV